jgi:sigma-B regulation protein RsbU (phosphoserine phosphatase)
MVDAIVATLPEPLDGPGAVLETVNRYLCAKSVESSFTTAFLAAFEPGSRTLRYARAGHNPPLVRAASEPRRIRLLDEVGDLPLGIDPDVRYADTETTLAPGETLVLYTDGITEAKNRTGELFGVERIEGALLDCSGAPGCAVDSIGRDLLAFEGGVRPGDDQTLLVLQVEGELAPSS